MINCKSTIEQATTLLKKGNALDAIRLLESLLESHPTEVTAKLLLTETYLNTRNYNLAAELAVKISGDLDFNQIARLARIFHRLNNFKSQNHLLRLLRNTGNRNVQLDLDFAESELRLGNTSQATEIYKQIVEAHPYQQKAQFELARLEDSSTSNQIQALADLVKRMPNKENSVFLRYALGKRLEDSKQFDKAFNQYKQAGKQAKAISNFTLDQDLACINAIIDHWQINKSTSNPASGSTPIFITGLPRSGTTVIERTLSNHAMVESINETFFFSVALQEQLGSSPLPLPTTDTMIKACHSPMDEIGSRYIALTEHLRTGADYFIEKLPENFLYLGFIAKALPSAKLIHVYRNPLDSCLGLFKQPFFRYAYTLEDLGHYYCAYHRLMQFWRSTLGNQLIEINYETFVSNPAEQAVRLQQALNLPQQIATEKIELNSSPSNSASASQVKKPIHQGSIDKWREYAEWLAPLKDFLQKQGVTNSNGSLLNLPHLENL